MALCKQQGSHLYLYLTQLCDATQPQVLGRMKQAMVEHSSSASHSFLLDDDSTLPFVANDILAQMDDKVRPCCYCCWGLLVRQSCLSMCMHIHAASMQTVHSIQPVQHSCRVSKPASRP
jgi:hypothetical protein